LKTSEVYENEGKLHLQGTRSLKVTESRKKDDEKQSAQQQA